MTVKNKKRVNQPALSTNAKLADEFVYAVDKKAGKKLDLKNIHNLTCGSGFLALWRCNNILPGTERLCNHEWYSIIKDRGMKGQGCPSCSGNEVTHNNCLATNRTDLSSEWDPIKNDKTPWQVTKSSTYVAAWICNVCKHKWNARVNDRYNNRDCPRCAGKLATPENNLAIKFPEISNQLHPDSEINPWKTLPYSNKLGRWLCPICSNSWHSIISSRTMQNSGCPCCHPQKSKHEMRILAELRAIFPQQEIKSGVKFEKKEADIFIPTFGLVIEYDGTFYHQNIIRDKQKNEFLKKLAYKF